MFHEILKPFSPINLQNLKPALCNAVGGIGKPGLPGIIRKDQGFKAKEGQGSGDCPDVVGVANTIQNKMRRA